MEKDIKLVEQISTFKRLPKGDSRWRVAFYYIAREFWDLEEVFVIIDKNLYTEQGLEIPVFREYQEAEGFQIFSSYVKAPCRILPINFVPSSKVNKSPCFSTNSFAFK